ncbi:MAG: type II toxin-antitoxin system MqsA family antitoxin [Actinomycetota bacterium]|nr:type II toxin-antitoxin system MqsA family antitoxin [Actinomycetota bacterium]
MACPVCRHDDLVEISLSLRGSTVTMHSCASCETRWWDKEGQRLALGQVLTLAVSA